MRLFILFAALVCCAPLFGQSRSDLAERNIKSVTIRNEELRKKGVRVEMVFERYDKNGNAVEHIEYGPDSIITRWERTEYNSNNDETLSEKLDSAGNVVRRTATEYDRWGHETRRTTYDGQGALREREETEYNNFGDKIRVSTYGKDGVLKERVEYEYDKRAMLIARKRYNAEGAVVETRTYTYQY